MACSMLQEPLRQGDRGKLVPARPVVPAQSHAAYMFTRPCSCAPTTMTNCGAVIAPSTEPVSPMLTRSLARDAPLTLPSTTTDFADKILVMPSGVCGPPAR